MTISVIVPYFGKGNPPAEIFPPLKAALKKDQIEEVLFVIDGDASIDLPEAFSSIRAGDRIGPGGCRNKGAERARGEVLLFLDADVVMHEDVPGIVTELFADPEIGAVFGSYDDAPSAKGIVSRYRNLLHHHTHQHGDEEAWTFWSGCGAIRKELFRDSGGFAAECFPRPAIEDIELGGRLRELGHRIRLDRRMQCTHLKRWTFFQMVWTDLFSRAIPWARLILTRKAPAQLNVSPAERWKALLALVAFASIPVAFFYPIGWVATGGLILINSILDRGLLKLLFKKGGFVTAAIGLLLRQLFFLYSTLGFLWAVIEVKILRKVPEYRVTPGGQGSGPAR